MKISTKRTITSPAFLVLLLFAVRLIGITNPPLEKGHSWRQCTGLMVARNFYEGDDNIMYPRVDEAGAGTGIIGMEFPLLYHLHYRMASVFGYTHWYGRLINLIISSLGLWYFSRVLLRLRCSKRMAWVATLALGVSIWFAFSRKTMPDTFSCSLMLVAIYYAVCYFEDNKIVNLLLYSFLASLALLSKIPAGILLTWLIPIGILKGTRHTGTGIVLASIIPLLLTYLWYYRWNPYLAVEYGNWYNIGKSFGEGIKDIATHLPETLKHFYFHAFCGYILTLLSVVGLVLAFVKRDNLLLGIGGTTLLVFIVYILKSGFYFYHHNYYIIPFVPVMAMFCAFALESVKPKWLLLLLPLVGAIECTANQQHDFFVPKSEAYKASLEIIMDDIAATDDLIAVNGNSNPQLIYFAHRKGWNCSDEQIASSDFRNTMKEQGCRWFVIDKHACDWRDNEQTPTVENDDFIIYSTPQQ